MSECDKCGVLAKCSKAKINIGHFGFMTTFAKCIGAYATIDEKLLAQRTFHFCSRCVFELAGVV